MRGQHLLDRAKRAAAKFPRHRVRPVQLHIDHAHQPNRLTLLFQFLVNPRMIASKDAHTHHRDGNRIISLQEKTLGWPVAPRMTVGLNCKRKPRKEHLAYRT
jgi:hypothetical protein